MKNWTKTIATGALMVLVAISMAQGQGGGGGRQGGGQRMGGRGGGMGSPASLINRADVQKDLAITDDQKTKLKDLQAKQMEEMQAQRQAGGGGGGGGFDREAMMKAMKERQEKNEKAVNEILTPEQQKRLKEIYVQLAGGSAILNEGIQKDLELTDDQKTKIKDLQTKQQEANAELRTKMQNQEIDRQQMQDIQKKNNDALKEELIKVLTADQAAKFKAMAGKEFKADPPAGGGGGN